MRFILTVLLGLTVLQAFTIELAFALPAVAPGASAQSNARSDIEDTRTFCYNRYTGQFKHWGACQSHHPRVYCRNTYTGQFLHWGAC